MLDGRGDRLILGVPVGLGHLVGPEPLARGQTSVERVRHRLDAAGVHGLKLVDQLENAVEPGTHPVCFRGTHGDARKPGDALDLVRGERHAAVRKKGTPDADFGGKLLIL